MTYKNAGLCKEGDYEMFGRKLLNYKKYLEH